MKLLPFISLLFLSACTTPVTTLQNTETGVVKNCGGGVAGSMAGGYLGYSIQKESDKECVKELKRQGYIIISEED